MLNDNNYSITGDDLSHDDNHAAYDEICDKIKGDLGFHYFQKLFMYPSHPDVIFLTRITISCKEVPVYGS